MTNIMPISKARSQLPSLVEDTAAMSKRTLITVKGKVKAALISAEELESLDETIEVLSDKETMKAIRESLEDIKAGRLIPLEETIKELDL